MEQGALTGVHVLVVCGAPGVGKSAAGWEIGHRLASLGVPHAVIDSDELDRVWPPPSSIDDVISITRRNLAAVWQTFADQGVQRLVLCGVIASPSLNETWIRDAVPGGHVTFVRLTADADTRARRLRQREVGSGLDHDLQSSENVAEFTAANDPRGMPVVSTDSKSVIDVAEQVLRTAGWLP